VCAVLSSVCATTVDNNGMYVYYSNQVYGYGCLFLSVSHQCQMQFRKSCRLTMTSENSSLAVCTVLYVKPGGASACPGLELENFGGLI